MKLEMQFDSLKSLLAKVGVEIFNIGRLELEEANEFNDKMLAILETEGIEIESLNEIEFIDGAIFYKNERVVIYIKDNRHYPTDGDCSNIDEFISTPKFLRKFHFSDCETIRQMKRGGKFERYIATTRKDGLFIIDAEFNDERAYDVEAKLLACRNCLKESNAYNFNHLPAPEKNRQVFVFDIKQFFNDYESVFSKIPERNEYNMQKNEYPDNWKEISLKIRKARGEICESCGKNCVGQKGALHVHHKNGNKWDNRPRNLKVLCVACHKIEHPNMPT